MEMEQFSNSLEIFRLVCAIDAYLKINPSPDRDHIRRGLEFLRKNEDLLNEGLVYIFGEVERQALKSAWVRARMGVFIGRGDKNPNKLISYREVLFEGFSYLSMHRDLLRSKVSEQRARAGMLGILNAMGDEYFLLDRLSVLPRVGSFTYPRKWIKFVSGGTEGSLEETEQLLVDVEGALGSAEKLADLNAQINSGRGDHDALTVEKEKVLAEIKDAAADSGSPGVVLAAVASKLSETREYRSAMGRKLKLSSEQEEAMLVTGKSIIGAGAGSGKTRVLAGKIVHLLESGVKPNQILAVSFTKDSANELKQRVLRFGGEAIKMNDTGFGTTHSVALKLLGVVDPVYLAGKQILMDDLLLREAILQVSVLPQGSVSSAPVPVSMMDEKLEAPLSKEDLIFQAILSDGLRVAEGALRDYGVSNRTQWAQMDRALFLPLKDKKVSEISPEQKAAFNRYLETNRGSNLIERLRRKDPNVSFGYRLASSESPASDDAKELKEQKDMLDKEEGRAPIVPVNQWFNLGLKVNTSKFALGRYALKITGYKSEMISVSEAWATDGDEFAAVYGAYEWLKNRDNFLDHDDYMIRLVQALRNNREKLSQLQNQYRHILVDEAQDLNKIQHLLFGLISGTVDPDTLARTGGGGMTAETYCLIGDDKQAIYEFRGASPELFVDSSDLTGGDFKTCLITMNYRSVKEIVEAANRLMSHNKGQIPMTCDYHMDRGSGVISHKSGKTPGDAAGKIVEEISKDLELEGWDSWNEDYPKYGVACRTNKELGDFVIECILKEIPFKSKPGLNPFNTKVYRALFAILDSIPVGGLTSVYRSIYTLYKYFDFGVGDSFPAVLKDLCDKYELSPLDIMTSNNLLPPSLIPYSNFIKKIRTYLVKEVSSDIVIDFILNLDINETTKVKDALLEIHRADGAKKNLSVLSEAGDSSDDQASPKEAVEISIDAVEVLRKFFKNPRNSNLHQAITQLQSMRGTSDKLQKDTGAPGHKAVVIDTCHGWKGLEAKKMWVMMSEGTFPKIVNEDELDEKEIEKVIESERRLAYVALTRGRDNVTVYYSEKDGPSRFISEACIPYISSDEDTIKLSSRIAASRMILDDHLSMAEISKYLRR